MSTDSTPLRDMRRSSELKHGTLPSIGWWAGANEPLKESVLRYLSIVLLPLLASCATQSVDREYVPTSESGKGVVTGSITYDGSYSGYRVWYKRLPDGDERYFEWGKGSMIIPYIPKGDFTHFGAKGAVFAAEIPPGEYEIDRWQVSSGAASVSPSQPFSIRFSIEPGRVTYVGNFHFLQTKRLGLTVTGVSVQFSDQAPRDIPVVFGKHPNFAGTPVAYAVPTGTVVDDIGGGYSTTITIPVFIPVAR